MLRKIDREGGRVNKRTAVLIIALSLAGAAMMVSSSFIADPRDAIKALLAILGSLAVVISCMIVLYKSTL